MHNTFNTYNELMDPVISQKFLSLSLFGFHSDDGITPCMTLWHCGILRLKFSKFQGHSAGLPVAQKSASPISSALVGWLVGTSYLDQSASREFASFGGFLDTRQ
jgi:hypothetical protein